MRALGFRYVAAMATYRSAGVLQAGTAPDVGTVRRPGHTKVGFGLNAEQTLTSDVGVFARVSYNDGRNETWAFTEID